METKKKIVILLTIFVIITISFIGIKKIGTKNENEKNQIAVTHQTLVEQVNNLNNNKIKEDYENTKETNRETEDINKRPDSLEAMQILHANNDYSFITSEDLYEHMDKMIGKNFLTIATVDKITDKKVTLILKDENSSIVFDTTEDYTKLVKSGKKVAVLGTIYEYNEVYGEKFATAWVSFIASGKDVEKFAEKVTNPCFSDIFE